MTKCSYPDCKRAGDMLVFSRKQKKVLSACGSHSPIIVEEGNPEDIACCPNCGCIIPVN